jgi:GT2 family glycosyltransferase
VRVSVIISSVDRSDRLARLLDNISRQSTLPDEVIVIEAGVRPLDEAIVPPRLYGRLVAFHAPRESLAASRDRGRLAAQGSTLIFFDDDLVVPDRYIEFALRHLDENLKVMAVGGIYLDPVTLRNRPWSIAIGRILGIFGNGSRNRILVSGWADYVRGEHAKRITEAEWLFGCNWAIRASAFSHQDVRIESRLAAWSFLEDVIFGSRITQAYGSCMRLLPELSVIHDADNSAGRISVVTLRMRILYRFIFWRETFDDGSISRAVRFWLGMLANVLLMYKQESRLWVIKECLSLYIKIYRRASISWDNANELIFSTH